MSEALGLVSAFVEEKWKHGLRREVRLSISEWADEFRELTGISARVPGRWRTSRTPYLREVMDALSPENPAERIVFMKGAQIGGTEAGNNWIGYTIHRNPGPMLMVLPTIDVARKVSKQRIAPMVRSSAVLRARVREARAKDSGNTLMVKEYEGGVFLMAGANSSAGLRSMPIRDIFFDEIDDYPADVDGQGDPLELAEERTATFEGIRKILLVSTPTVKGISKIEKQYLERSDQRRFYIPCPHCEHMDFLTWNGRDWLASTDGTHHRISWEEGKPETAHMRCGSCDAHVAERYKSWMLRRGEWRPTIGPGGTPVGDGKTIGFHLSGLYSPLGWKSWAVCVGKFLKAKNDPPALKGWVNQTLGETWEERGDSIEPHVLRRRCAKLEEGATGWPQAGHVPHGVGVLVAAVDVHPDRLEAVVKGYGAGEESWLIDYQRLDGDPSATKIWSELDRYLAQQFPHASGRRVRIERVAVDSGGVNTEEVYRYCKPRVGRGVFAIKGGSFAGRPLVDRPSLKNRYRLPLFVLCVDTGKEIVLSRLQVDSPGPGFMHLPDWVDDEYLDQLTAEKGVRKYVKGRGWARVWLPIRTRNEALDLEVYALAALYIMGQPFIRELAAHAAALSKPTDKPGPSEPTGGTGTLREPGRAFPRRRPRGWVDKWRE